MDLNAVKKNIRILKKSTRFNLEEVRSNHSESCSHTYQCTLGKGLACNVDQNKCLCDDIFFL